ncbi:hypothetical protein ABZ864_48185 [Streptomyces sp. NPDC047082]|uniref:hypothetical protein n=1 Tax=Streptomyces sp. NPDC047082 TaxID=3155259 RepID=UPI0033EE5FD2
MFLVMLVNFASAVIGFILILSLSVIPFRLWRRAQEKGYRGPAVQVFLVTWVTLMLCVGIAAVLGLLEVGVFDVSDMWIGVVCVASLLVPLIIAEVLAAVVVFALPRRRHRPGGPRSVRIPYRFLGWLTLSLTAAITLSLVVLGSGASWVRPVYHLWFILGSVAFWCFSQDNREDKPARDEALSGQDSRPPVMYVRGFSQEMQYFAPRPPGPQEVAAGPVLDSLAASQRPLATFEEYLQPTVEAVLGPWRGLGNPTDYLPPRGIRRMYALDEHWENEFRDLVAVSQGILILPGAYPHLVWELYTIKELEAQQRVFVLTAPSARRRRDVFNWALGTKIHTWQQFVDAATATVVRKDRKTGIETRMKADYTFGGDPGPGAVVTFDHSARQVVLAQGILTPADYVTVIHGRLRELRDP